MDKWVQIAKDADEASTSFIDNNYRRQWEDNIRHFHSKHASGSKYYSDSYQYRSRLFNPKTRSMERSNEAAAAAAFFTNSDAVSIEPFNRKNLKQKFSADLREGLLNYHLDNTIPWFQILCGGMQDAQVQGCVVSKQYWDLKHETFEADGKFYRQVIKDQPVIDLIPIENLRIDPAAKWYDPINTSPYVQIRTPMYIGDIKEKIESGEWENINDDQWAQARVKENDTTKQARQDGKQDTSEVTYTEELTDFDQCWVIENFIRHRGKEVTYYTLGTIALLTKAEPLRDVYWHGIRPVSLGRVIIETHTPLSPGTVEISMPLQKEINEVTNTRRDNVKLVLNKRYIVGRGKQVDLKSLVRNAPGSITMANDVDADIRALEFNDVTGSSYAEHDRLNLEYDELVGNFSGSSVQSNRKMNETVGGMAMIRGSANTMTQYLISVFAETWVNDVLHQMDQLIQNYESNIEVMQEIAEERGLFNQYKIATITPELLKERAKVVINVTNSATDPMVKLEQFLLAVQKYNEITATAPMDMDLFEVRKEIFGRLGYKNGLRFFVDPDSDVPMVVEQLQQQIQQLTQVIEGKQVEEQAKADMQVRLAELKGQLDKELESMRQSAETQRKAREIEAERQMSFDKLIADTRTTKQVEQLKSDTQITVAKIKDNSERRKNLQDTRQKLADDSKNGEIKDFSKQIDELMKKIEAMEKEEKKEPEEKESLNQEFHFHNDGKEEVLTVEKVGDGKYRGTKKPKGAE